MRLGIPVYEGVNLLDVAGPLEMFYWADQETNRLQTVLVSEDGGGVTSINGVYISRRRQVSPRRRRWMSCGSPGANPRRSKRS